MGNQGDKASEEGMDLSRPTVLGPRHHARQLFARRPGNECRETPVHIAGRVHDRAARGFDGRAGAIRAAADAAREAVQPREGAGPGDNRGGGGCSRRE